MSAEVSGVKKDHSQIVQVEGGCNAGVSFDGMPGAFHIGVPVYIVKYNDGFGGNERQYSVEIAQCGFCGMVGIDESEVEVLELVECG